jgi:hypothetical protein
MMKQLVFLLLLILVSAFTMQAQNAEKTVDDISEAFREGDSRKLSNHFGMTLVVELPGKTGSYSKSQAQMIMRDFFSANKPNRFDVDHQGNNRDGSRFIIATLDSRQKRFRVFVVMKQQKAEYLIHHLNISEHEQ